MPTETSPPKRGRKPKHPAPMEPMQTTEQIVRIPLTELHPFPDHPYGIREDQAMQDTVDSVKQNGVVVPAIVRPRAAGGYEIVAGHRRKLASEQAGFTDMPCIIRNLTDDEAIIQLVDSNAQREDVLPSERAKAYKMRLEAIKRTAGRPRKELSDNEPLSENAPNNSANFRSDDEVGNVDGISGDTVRNIISLNNLVPELMQMVDEKKISLTPAYQIAALTEPEQRLLLETIDSEQATPSVSQAQRMRKLSQSGELNDGEDQKLTQLVFCDISTPKGRTVTEPVAAKAAGGILDSPEIHALETLIPLEEKTERPFTIYEDIRQKLIAGGMLPDQIAFIHDADTEVRKRELFAKVRTGQVRVLIGSTQKMGAGTNVQDRLIALHDLDCPWRPRDLTQRKGRIERQGNTNPLVHVCRYVTEGTFDAYLWQTVENKQKFISQIMTSKSPVRSCEDVDETALSFAEIKALCAGDPRIKERMDLDVEVSKLKIMKADHQSKQYRLEDQLLKYFPEQIEQNKGFIRGFEADMKTLEAHPLPQEGFIGMVIRGDNLTDKENAGAALIDALKDVKSGGSVEIGTYRGFTMTASFESMFKQCILTLHGEMTHRVEMGEDPRGNLIRIDNALAKMPERLTAVKAQLENLYHQQEAAKAEVGKPFPYEADLTAKTARLVELDMQLNLGGGHPQPQPEQTVAKRDRPSILDRLKQPLPQKSSTDKHKTKKLEASL